MFRPAARRGFAALAASVSALAFAGPAQATVTTTNITSPSSSPFFTYTDDDAAGTDVFTVAGTSDGTTGDDVNILCTYSGGSASTLASTVPVNADGTFSTTSADKDEYQSCVLRAVPSGMGYSSYDALRYTGPSAAFGETYLYTNTSNPAGTSTYDYYLQSGTLATQNEYYSLGDCGLTYTYLLTADLDDYFGTWDCNAYFDYYQSITGRSGLQVDGHNAYTPAGAYYINQSATGLPVLTADRSFDAATGQWKVTETNPIVFCADSAGAINDVVNSYPNGGTCPQFVDAGLAIVRTITESQAGRVVSFSDDYRSTNGAQHAVTAWYANYLDDDTTRLPGESGYTSHTGVYTLPASSAGTIYSQTDEDYAPGTGNLQGALTYLTAPDQLVFDYDSLFHLRYDRTVPAAGSVVIPHVYSSGFTREAVQSAAQGAEDANAAPAVQITFPANGTTVSSDAVTAAGTASDNVGVRSLTVNGIPTTVNSDGSWSQRVPLQPGANTITAIATDGSGQSAQAQTAVNYAPPAAPACTVPKVVGQTATAAANALAAAGCTVGVTTQTPSSVAKGSIASQAKAAGTKLPAYFPIDLKVSSGPVGKAKLKTNTARIKKGRVKLKLQCPPTSGNVCNGTVKLRTHGKLGGKKRTLGTKAFQTPAGRSRTTTFKLAKSNRKRLDGKTTKVDVYIVFRDEDGKSLTTKDSLKIKG